MGTVKGVCWIAAAAALIMTPAATAGQDLSVGYTTPSALRGLHVVRRVPALRLAEVRVPSAGAARALRARPGIRFAQRTVTRVSADESPALAAGAASAWQSAAAHLDLVPAWVRQAAAGVTIAVVDTGADLAVPSLAAKSPTTWNVVTGTPTVRDLVGHGTFVASLAAGSGADGAGMTGFGGDAKLMVVQANRGSTGFTDVDEAAGITWAVDHGARIVNLSLGGTRTSSTERSAIAYAQSKGVLIVAAAGNSAEQGNPTTYPAALLGPSGLAVGAATKTGGRAPFSSIGTWVDLLAPGVDVLGALASSASSSFFTAAATPGAAGSFGFGSGTSYAAPEAAGAAALVWAANPLLDAAGVAATLEASASGNGAWTTARAYGNLDVAEAVAHAVDQNLPQLAVPAITAPARTPKPTTTPWIAPTGERSRPA